jgi:hypothetical protein
VIGGLIGGIAGSVATELGAASAIGQGNKPMIDHLRAQAIPRIGVWLALAVWALVRMKNIITGEGRDLAFSDLKMSTGTQVGGIVIALGIAALCALAAWRTFSVERRAPAQGTLWFPGYRLPLFGEWTLAITGGLLLLVGLWMWTSIPEAYAAGQSPVYAHYNSAGATQPILMGGFFAGMGFVCMIVRRSRWELAPGQPLVRRALTAFTSPKPRGAQIALKWEDYWMGQGVMRRQIGWVLRGMINNKNAFEIAFAPLPTSVEQRAALGETWKQALSSSVNVTSVDPGLFGQ